MSRGGNVCSKCRKVMPMVDGVIRVFPGGRGSCCAPRGARGRIEWFTARGASDALKERYASLAQDVFR